MNMHVTLSSMAVCATVLANPTSQEFQGKITGEECSKNLQEIMNVVGDDGQPTDLFGMSRDLICTPDETYTIWVRGFKILMEMDEGEVGIDYENADDPTFTMYNPRNDTHVVVNAKKLENLQTQMMGGQKNAPNVGGIMGQIRDAAGVEVKKAEGPYRSKHTVDCEDGERWAAHQGEIGPGGNPMEPRWHMDFCVTQKYPALTKAFHTLAMASNPFAMEQDDPKEEMEGKIAERGFPVESRELTQGGGLTGMSLEFSLRSFTVEPGTVPEARVNAAKGTEEPDLMKFFMAYSQGMP